MEVLMICVLTVAIFSVINGAAYCSRNQDLFLKCCGAVRKPKYKRNTEMVPIR